MSFKHVFAVASALALAVLLCSCDTLTPVSVPEVFPNPPADYTMPYYIYCEKGSHTVTIYARYSDGSYKEYKKFPTATGLTSGRTPVGEFTLGGRDR
ncbi:MAG: hypothetical protein LBQ48_05040, partial [Oscillospiraceae bacterium]|nr:hypothetical protein [Oscillospiraceae bacterium]